MYIKISAQKTWHAQVTLSVELAMAPTLNSWKVSGSNAGWSDIFRNIFFIMHVEEERENLIDTFNKYINT